MTGRGIWRSLIMAALFGLAACNAGGAVGSGHTTTPDGTRTASATLTSSGGTPTSRPSAVVVPEAARAHTQAGAEAFARFYLRATSGAFMTLDLSTVRGLSRQTCGGCRAIEKAIDDQAALGLRVPTVRLSIRASNVQPGGTSDSHIVDVIGEERASDLVDRNGRAVSHLAAMPMWSRVGVMWADGAWRVSELSAVKNPA